MIGLQPDGQWPVWQAPQGMARPDADGYGRISCFVTTQALESFTFVFPPGLRARYEGRFADRAEADRRIVSALWRALADRQVAYAAPPWNPAEGQRIRDPAWLLRRKGSGTCIDFALLFAAACLNERLNTSLVMLRSENLGHVGVAVRLGWEPAADLVPPSGAEPDAVPGVARVYDADALAGDEDLLLLDATAAAAGDQGLEADAAARLAALLTGRGYPDIRLVDVAVRHHGGDLPLPPPKRHGALLSRLPQPERTLIAFPSHAPARAALRDLVGKVVIRGPQGIGKSALARQAAAEADHGYGWFLPATSREAFEAALARRELAERGRVANALEAPERSALARNAMARLGESDDDWVILIDNVDDGPKRLGQLPEPRDGQLILATTTSGAEQWPGWHVLELPLLSEAELADELPDKRLARLATGTPLLMTAFSRLLESAPDLAGQLSEQPPGRTTAEAAEYWWSLARQAVGDLTGTELLAWMPPDRIDHAALAGNDVGWARLAAVGLLGVLEAGVSTMHRLFGSAVRREVAAAGRAEDVARRLLGQPLALASLIRNGDARVTAALAEALERTESGQALWALGTVQEVYQGSLSAATFARAEPLLDPADPAQASALADCLHARGRVANQAGDSATDDEIREAIAATGRALRIRPHGDGIGLAKHQALLALLRQRAAKRMLRGSAEQIRELTEVMAALDDSYLRRRDALGDDDPLVDRAYFNRAGVRIALTVADPALAARCLPEAEKVYRHTERFRRLWYRDPNPITASSVAGIATWGYYAIVSGVAEDVPGVLAESVRAAVDSLVMRSELGVGGDVAKSAALLAKLSALQLRLVEGKPEAVIAEMVDELGLSPQVLDAALSARERSLRRG